MITGSVNEISRSEEHEIIAVHHAAIGNNGHVGTVQGRLSVYIPLCTRGQYRI